MGADTVTCSRLHIAEHVMITAASGVHMVSANQYRAVTPVVGTPLLRIAPGSAMQIWELTAD